MTKIDELYTLLDQEGKELAVNMSLENDGRDNYIIVCEDEAETSDERFIFETYDVYAAYEFLLKNCYLSNK